MKTSIKTIIISLLLCVLCVGGISGLHLVIINGVPLSYRLSMAVFNFVILYNIKKITYWIFEKLEKRKAALAKKETAVKPHRWVAVCPCGGEYEFTGLVLTSNPPLYVHECYRCHLRTNLKSISPDVRYEQKEVKADESKSHG